MHLNVLFKQKNLKYGYKLRWRLPARSVWCNVNHCDMEKGTNDCHGIYFTNLSKMNRSDKVRKKLVPLTKRNMELLEIASWRNAV